MRAGALRHTAEVYTKSTTPDAYGALDSTEVLLGKYKCSLTPRYWQERAENGETLARVRYELVFRWYTELAYLNPNAEIVVDGRRLVVMNISDPRGKHGEIRVLAEERQ